MIITTPAPEGASGAVAAMYREDLAADGFVHSYTAAMAVNPEAHEAFVALVKAVLPSIGIRVYEAATLGAARAIGSSHCLIAHARKSMKAGVADEAGLRVFAEDEDSAFTDSERAVIRFAERLSTSPHEMTDADAADLREHGFSDRQIVDITLAAGLRNHFSRSLLALAVPLDEDPLIAPELASALRHCTERADAQSGQSRSESDASASGSESSAAAAAGSTQ
ncbi:carboxymuconolactone decarboxylase family protein [Microbacterium esteraromaticum]|uniref:Carboxymuconolactone decarboxylase family protein n=1 Tax=Microbacterium esteraromaticum TaxID=57043 RepID=A0A7D8AHE3_9MICO|nr:carboxymuconolactone decarboxylase family protein [Microbacterium esteraromaticum]QMU97642.1 carboxymuconolactone decarboxylase family protein [Microbacterium esteraromaticum]